MALFKALPPPLRAHHQARTMTAVSSINGFRFYLPSENRNIFYPFNYPSQSMAFQCFHCISKKNKRLCSATKNQTSLPLSELTIPSVPFCDFNDQKPSAAWQNFATNVSGEWDGYGAEFSPKGVPSELPESVVPEAYREWEVRVYDWQTQCPTIAKEDIYSMRYKAIKLLPTVGCEADAAARYSEDQRHIGGTDNKVSSFVYHSSGCYAAIWPQQSNSKETDSSYVKTNELNSQQYSGLEVEHCLVKGKNSKSRVRIIQIIDLPTNVEKNAVVPELKKLVVFCEDWYGPFRDGEQLGGCAISGSAFASTNPLDISQIEGVWKSHNLVAELDTDHIFKEFLDTGMTDATRDLQNLTVLPKNLWYGFRAIDDGRFITDVGWLWDSNNAVTMTCEVSVNGSLKTSTVRLQQQ